MTVGADHADRADPFHLGERELQRRYGAREDLAGSRAIRAEIPPGFDRFLATLSYVVVGVTDEAGRPWAALLAAGTGVASILDPTRLLIRTTPALRATLPFNFRAGGPIAVLAIDLARRARVRLNGAIAAAVADGITIDVREAFGNCPQYIWPRTMDVLPDGPASGANAAFGTSYRQQIIDEADTFFVASRFTAADGRVDLDVSHRGGLPGFVRRVGDALEWDEYRGNFYFNTLGNLLLDSACGLLIPRFATGEALSMTGTAALENMDGRIARTADGLAVLGSVRFEPASTHDLRLGAGWHTTGGLPMFPRG